MLKQFARKLWRSWLTFRQRIATRLLYQILLADTSRPTFCFQAAFLTYFIKRLIQQALTAGPPWRIRQLRFFQREMLSAFLAKLYLWSSTPVGYRFDPYFAHARNNRLTAMEAARMRERAERFEHRPLISILVPVFNAEPMWLDRLVASVEAQTYDRWELILVDDGSTSAATRDALERLAEHDRLVIERLSENAGVAAATNAASRLASGEFIAFVDHDDELLPDALWWIALRLNHRPESDIIYTDEELVPETGAPPYPCFKPGFAPESLTAYNYICHLLVLRKTLFDELGGLRSDTNGAQDYDLILRAIERTSRVEHVARVLYRWHIVRRSFSRVVDPETNRLEQTAAIDPITRQVVQDHFDRRGMRAEAVVVDRWVRPRFEPVDHGKVSIIVCTRDQPRLLWRLVRSIECQTDYPNYEIIIVDNGSKTRRGRLVLGRLARRHTVHRIENGPEGFNFSRLNNEAVRRVNGSYVLFLNDDTRVLSRNWLSAMVGYLQFDGVGAAGARLLYPNGRIQHAGLVIGAMGWGPWHALIGVPGEGIGYGGYMNYPHNCAAVTGACLLTPRSLFLEMGGFDEKELAVSFNDVDYCLRLHRAGWRCVFVPQAELIHYEGRSRGKLTDPREMAAMRGKTLSSAEDTSAPDVSFGLFRDPYWNPGFSRQSPHFAFDSRRRARHLFPDAVPRVLVVGSPLNASSPTPHWQPLFDRLSAEGKCAWEPLTVSDSRAETWGDEMKRRLAGDPVDLVFVQGPKLHAAIETANDANVPSIWHVPASPVIEPESDRVARLDYLRFVQTLDLPYQVVFSNRHSLAWTACGQPRHNFSVIESLPLEAPRNEADRANAREQIRSRWRIPAEAVVLLADVPFQAGDDWRTVLRAYGLLPRRLRQRSFLFLVGERGHDFRITNDLRRQLRRVGPGAAALEEPNDPLDYYAAADIVVSHATVDIRPLSVLRALQHALPVLGTPELWRADLLYPEANGIGFQAFDPRSLRRAMARLIDDASLRVRLGINALAWLESRAHPDYVFQQWSSLLVEAFELSQPRGGRQPIAPRVSPDSAGRPKVSMHYDD